jgi:hypothetical protein
MQENQPNPAKPTLRNKIYAAVISAIFLFLFVWCPLTFILTQSGVLTVSDISLKNERPPERIYEGGPFAGVLNKIEEGKAGLENLYTNFLPFYPEIVTLLGSLNTDIQMSFADLLAGGRADTAGDGVPVSGQLEFSTIMLMDDGLHRYYAVRPFDFLDTAISLPEETLRRNMESQIAHINRLAAAASDSSADFYVFIGKRMQDAEYFNEIIPSEISTAHLFAEFTGRITGASGVAALDVDTLEARLENIFLTDHHWTALGIYRSYADIIAMMNAGEPLPLRRIAAYEDVTMRGASARIASFSRFTDSFGVIEVDLPPQHDVYRIADISYRYENGTFDKNLYADHYEQFYTRQNRFIYPENNTGRNLLIIGDSFTWWSAWLIAANFDETTVIYPWDRETLDLSRFIAENSITDVLCLMFSDRILFDIYNDTQFDNILTVWS